MNKFLTRLISSFLFLALVAGFSPTVSASTGVEKFYKNKTVRVVIPVGTGGALSQFVLMLAPYLEKYIPGNPTVVMTNMPGGGGIRAGNYLYNVAPRDGTVIGMVLAGTPMAARLGAPGVKFDPRHFNYLAGGNTMRSVITVRRDTGVRTFSDLTRIPVIVGATGMSSTSYFIPQAANVLLGTKFKIVKGYRGMGPIDMAVERGEVQGRVTNWEGTKATRGHWLTNNFVVNLAVVSLTKEPDLPNLPLLVDLAKTEQNKQIFRLLSSNGLLARAFFTPPGVDKDRLLVLREAFWKAFNDPEFQAKATSKKIDINPIRGLRLQKAVADVMNTPQDIVNRTRKVLNYK